MQKTEKMYVYTQSLVRKISDVHNYISDAVILSRIVFDPLFLEYEHQQESFSQVRVNELMRELLNRDQFTLRIHDGQSETVIQKYQDILIERHYFTKEQFLLQHAVILDYVERRMKNGQFAYLRSYDEFLYHNIEKIEHRKIVEPEEVTAELPKKKTSNGEVIIDGYYFSGYDLFYAGLCYTSCWRMYFSEDYGAILPLDLLREMQQVETISEIYENTLMIELYRDPYLWDVPANLEFQRMFRNQLGVDYFSRMEGVGLLQDPYIEFQFSPDVFQLIQYQNDFLQPTSKKRATHFVTRSYQLSTRKQQVKRVKGALNVQAFFPLVDDQNKRMQRMIPLLLEQTVDNGLAAYKFYIRDYLDIVIQEEKYLRYLPILTFLLSEEDIAQVPLNQLRMQMSDIRFSEEKTGRHRREIRLNKGDRQLKVEFCSLKKNRTARKQLDELRFFEEEQ